MRRHHPPPVDRDDLTVVQIHRLAAFTTDPAGGNPAGVVVTDTPLDAAVMQRIAAEVGFSETAFLVPGDAPLSWSVRYFAPAAEVPFCGPATVEIIQGEDMGRRSLLTVDIPPGTDGIAVTGAAVDL